MFLQILDEEFSMDNLRGVLAWLLGSPAETLDRPLHCIEIRRPGKEFRLHALIGGYEVLEVMLDLGSDVNILPNQSWEFMGQSNLVYSPILLLLAN